MGLADIAKCELRCSSGVECDSDGYVKVPFANLLPGVRREQFESDLKKGGGHELETKFRALHSSSALAVNTFAPFKNDLSSLSIVGKKGFRRLTFEKQLPTGLRGTPPNLDVYMECDNEAVAIESKFLEYCSPKVAKYSSSYSSKALPCAEQCWWDVLQKSKNGKLQHLDVAQLVKHYFGLIRLLKQGDEKGWKPEKVTLLYLFWEPANAKEFQECKLHREEIEDFVIHVSASNVGFKYLSYPELWASWDGVPEIAAHVANLRARYCFRLPIPYRH